MANKARIQSSLHREYRSCEAAVSALLGKFPKTHAAANHCRVGAKQLSAYANPNISDRHMPVDVVLSLEIAAQEPVVTRYLAGKQNWVMFQLPGTGTSSKWDHHLRNIVKEGSEVFLQLANALEDGKISHGEAVNLLNEVDDAMSAFAGLRNSLIERIATASTEAPTTTRIRRLD